MPCKLAVVGDSLSQGFQDGAIGRDFPLRSFPAIVARALGLTVGTNPTDAFRVPTIPGDGLPLDILALLGRIRQRTGAHISALEWPTKVLPEVAHYFDELETFYERGPGARPVGFGGVYHNLAAYGLTVFEGTHLTSRLCDQQISDAEGWFRDDLFGTPSGAKYRAAKLVLDPDGRRPDATQLDNLDYLVNGNAQLGIEADPPDALIVWLGANDCLGTVVALEVHDMPPDAGSTIGARHAFNLTSDSQFLADYRALAVRIDAILGGRDIPVFVGTIPDVSIPPLAKGVGTLKDGLFDYYVRFFVKDEDRPPPLHKRLTRADVATVQMRIRRFNDHVRTVSGERRNWHVVEIADVLDQLAVRRNHHADPAEPLRQYYAREGRPNHPLLTPALVDPVPSLLTLRSDQHGKRLSGGLTSLDGVHPTTIGYGIAAEVFLKTMQAQGISGADPMNVDWPGLIAQDRLLRRAPVIWQDFLAAAADHSLVWDLLFRSLAGRT